MPQLLPPLKFPATGFQPGAPNWNGGDAHAAGVGGVADIPGLRSRVHRRRCRVLPRPAQSPTTGVQPGVPYLNGAGVGAGRGSRRCAGRTCPSSGRTTPMPKWPVPVQSPAIGIQPGAPNWNGVTLGAPGGGGVLDVPRLGRRIDHGDAVLPRARQSPDHRHPARRAEGERARVRGAGADVVGQVPGARRRVERADRRLRRSPGRGRSAEVLAVNGAAAVVLRRQLRSPCRQVRDRQRRGAGRVQGGRPQRRSCR